MAGIGIKDIVHWQFGQLSPFMLMLAGAIGTGVVPREYFGIPERFSVFAATGFNAVLEIYLFYGFEKKQRTSKSR